MLRKWSIYLAIGIMSTTKKLSVKNSVARVAGNKYLILDFTEIGLKGGLTEMSVQNKKQLFGGCPSATSTLKIFFTSCLGSYSQRIYL